ncbi:MULTISPECIES: GNAT family N-acetyltransferase [Kitasatospora]|uniref:Putative acetyltransferase n=1 Tax=Kitasatospora setae (strain ATCC 33774 / DSM 43861 / JCM 3304 / KCC A-0304 / NBRC 14216 / KM-6054) TaxID=452652 RepID=E4N7W0_KITSK|nr:MULTISPECIES: GNAT family N-acetyltransferase [Kitasatospora]BAJ27291.1 putative acetyltransferase [Kitasatospora setae KM-6054]
MTTTLRPDGAEEPGVGGGRTQRWHVMVNGRRVGGLRTNAWARSGRYPGEICELEIAEPDRRRGRGTVAVLAAEEVLRSWGCVRAQLLVPAGATVALRLAQTLGYVEQMRNLDKDLGELPPLPAGLTAHPMTEQEFPAWRQTAIDGYRADLVAGGLGADEAATRAAEDHRRALPAGLGTVGTVLRRLRDADGTVLGTVWVTLHQDRHPDGGSIAWVMVVEVAPEHRGRGHGRALMHLAERECLRAGVRHLGLNVFSTNAVAIGLYESLGYRPTRYVLNKPLL